MRVAIRAIMFLYAFRRTTGIARDSRDGVSDCRRHLTEYLMMILTKRVCSFTTASDREFVCDVKDLLAYIALDFHTGVKVAFEGSDKKGSPEARGGSHEDPHHK